MSNFWWKKAIIYELYVDKFAGNFKDLTEKVSYLANLGVDCIHILPHYPSPMVDDGYDVSDYCNVRPELGTLADFEAFFAKAREVGIRIMVDLVLNHTSVCHPWFLKALKNPKSSEHDYYLWSRTGKEFKDAINAFPHLKANNWVYHKSADAYHFSTFYAEQADLNWDNPLIFDEICSIMDFWVSRGASAFRLDAISHIIKREGTNSKGLPETHAVIKKIRRYIEKHHPDVALVGEVHDTPKRMREYFGNGDECHLIYHFPLAEALALKLALGRESDMQKLLKRIGDVPYNASWLASLRHHDDLSLATLLENDRKKLLSVIDPQRHFRFEKGVSLRLQNICDRSLVGDETCMRTAFELLFGIPSAAMLYYGDEIGARNVPINKLQDTRRAVRGLFDWTEAKRQLAAPDSLLAQVRQLIFNHKKL